MTSRLGQGALRWVLAALWLVVAIDAQADTSPSDPPRTDTRASHPITVTRQADLPRHSYALTTPTASALLDDEAAFHVLASQVRKDTETTLRDYDIRDANAKADLYVVLRNLALLRGDASAERDYGARIRALQGKPAARLTYSLLQDAAATADTAPPTQRSAAYRQALAAAIQPMPWPVVEETLQGAMGRASTPNAETLLRAELHAHVDPAAAASGRLSDEQANAVISARATLKHLLPYSADTVAVIDRISATHRKAKADIWSERAVALPADRTWQPVVLAVWDEGVDVALFPGRLFVNDKERPDGRDDDGNGFVDDVHGIAFDEHDQPSSGPMLRFDDFYPGREAELRELSIGHGDATAGRATPAAAHFRQRVATLKPEQVTPLWQAGMFYDGFYSHGTHVAGIAMQGNPAARLLVVRYNSDAYHVKPPPITDEAAERYARNVKAIVDYMKARRVRVVNMSFGLGLSDIESSLEANNVGADPKARTAMAEHTLSIVRDAFAQAMRDAPDILFVAAAGNSDTDLAFAPDVPAGIALPNVIAVGAVDHAGDAASFTSYGKQVAVFANGDEVDSVVPGGFHEKKSGTSMAAPQVTNLAAKLFAIEPSLTPAQCIELIKSGATLSADGKRRLIDPRRTVASVEDSVGRTPRPETTP